MNQQLKYGCVLAVCLGAGGFFPGVVVGAEAEHPEHHMPAAIGQPGKPSEVTRDVAVNMTDDMRFSPAQITVRQGETIRFVVTNSGQLVHEFVIDTHEALKAHNEVMKKHPAMQHDEPNEISVAPGQKGELVWQFTRSGVVDFACLEPGHFDAGMKGAVNVVAEKTKQQKGEKYVAPAH